MFPIIKIKTTHTNNVLKMCDIRKQEIITSTYYWIHAFRVRPNLKRLLQINSNVPNNNKNNILLFV